VITPREVGEVQYGDRLWLVTPFWDEGEDYEYAQGTSSLVVAHDENEAEQFAVNGPGAASMGFPNWVEVKQVEVPRDD